MTFGDPRWLWALAALPLFALLEWLAARRRRAALGRLVGTRLDGALLAQVRPRQRAMGALLRIGAAALLIVGAARPEWGREVVRRGSTGSDVVLVVDVSASMDARDVPPSRLDEARREALAVIDRLGGSRFGVVAFAGEAIRLCPPTLDRAAARLTVEGLSSLAVAEPGTDLGKGLRTALRLLPNGRRDEQVIVLWTDGEDLEQGAAAAVEDAVRSGVRVFAIGVGTPAGDVVPVVDDHGRVSDIKRDENGAAVRSRLDDALLRQLARRTRGGYFSASRPGGELPRLLASLGAVAASGRGNRLIERPVARFMWFGLAAAVLLVIEALGRRRRISRESSPPSAAGTRAVAALIALSFVLPAARVEAQSAWAKGDRAFKAGKYAAAESLYTLRLKDPKAAAAVKVNRATARALAGHGPEGIQELDDLAARDDRNGRVAGYNQGTLLGEANQYDPALKALRRALERDPKDADARFNYEVVLQRRQEEQQKNPEQQPKQPEPKPNPSPQPSQPQPQNPQPNPNAAPQPQEGEQPQPRPQQGMERAQADQILNALEELQRMEQQNKRKVRVMKERRGRDW